MDDDYHDVMQVCLNGHKITAYANSQPISRQAFCAQCGAKTTMTCEACGLPISGYRHISGVFHTQEPPVPKFCIGCGKPFPWQTQAILNLTEVLREGGLSDQDIKVAEDALPDIVRDTPKTELASLRFGKLLGKLGKPVYEITIKVLSDIASETAKKTMRLSGHP